MKREIQAKGSAELPTLSPDELEALQKKADEANVPPQLPPTPETPDRSTGDHSWLKLGGYVTALAVIATTIVVSVRSKINTTINDPTRNTTSASASSTPSSAPSGSSLSPISPSAAVPNLVVIPSTPAATEKLEDTLLKRLTDNDLLLNNNAQVFAYLSSSKGQIRHARLLSTPSNSGEPKRIWQSARAFTGTVARQPTVAIKFPSAELRKESNILFGGIDGQTIQPDQLEDFKTKRGIIVSFPSDPESNQIVYITAGICANPGKDKEGLAIKFDSRLIPYPETIELSSYPCK